MLEPGMALSVLAERAVEVARAVTTLTTALVKEGMPAPEARHEARTTVTLALLLAEDSRLTDAVVATCPLCGKVED